MVNILNAPRAPLHNTIYGDGDVTYMCLHKYRHES